MKVSHNRAEKDKLTGEHGLLMAQHSELKAEKDKLTRENCLLMAQYKELKAEKDNLVQKKFSLDVALGKSNTVIVGLENRLDETKGLAETMEVQLKLQDQQDKEEFDLFDESADEIEELDTEVSFLKDEVA